MTNERKHVARYVSFSESSTGVGKQILPFTPESIEGFWVRFEERIVRRQGLWSQVLVQPPIPLAECSWIILEARINIKNHSSREKKSYELNGSLHCPG